MTALAAGAADEAEKQPRDVLPKPPPKEAKPHITIGIKKDGGIKVNGRTYEKSRALKKIEKLGKEKPMSVVLIRADDNAKHESFVAVINTLARAGVKNITMAGFRAEGEKDP